MQIDGSPIIPMASIGLGEAPTAGLHGLNTLRIEGCGAVSPHGDFQAVSA